jgi:hypothetical protein
MKRPSAQLRHNFLILYSRFCQMYYEQSSQLHSHQYRLLHRRYSFAPETSDSRKRLQLHCILPRAPVAPRRRAPSILVGVVHDLPTDIEKLLPCDLRDIVDPLLFAPAADTHLYSESSR